MFVEKPLAQSSREAAHLVELAGSRGLVLMVGHLLLYHPAVEKLRELKRSGDLGEIRYLYTQRVNLGKIRQDENALWSFGPHDVSVILDLVEQLPVRVWAAGHAYLQSDLEDVVFVHLEFATGQIAHIHLSWLDPHKLRRLTVVGERKMAVFDDMEATEKVRIYDKGVRGVPAEMVRVQGRAHAPLRRHPDSAARRCRSRSSSSARTSCSPSAKGAPAGERQDGLRVVQVLEAAAHSLAGGGVPVRLEPVLESASTAAAASAASGARRARP